MQLNRRSFLKIAGAAGVGSMLTGKLTGSELPPQQQPPAKQLKSIYLEAYKKHNVYSIIRQQKVFKTK